MRACNDIQQTFAEALYDELPPDQRRDFDDHLHSCPACSDQFARFRRTLAVMDERTRPEPDPASWGNFWQRLRPQLDEPRRPVILQWIPRRIPAWSYAVAAVLVLAAGVYIGRQTTVTNVTPRSGRTAETASLESDSTTRQALAYLERSRNLLLGVTNLDDEHLASIDLGHQQEVSRKLITQGQILAIALNRPNQQQMRQLVEELGVILLQLANVEVKPGVPAIELVRKGVDDKSILLKINLEEMRSMAGRSSKRVSGRHESPAM